MNVVNCFSYVHKVLYEAGIDDTDYSNLFDLINHLHMQYSYSNDSNKEKIVLELQGLLSAISQLQQTTGVSLTRNDVELRNINALLACA
ncbi:MAG: hypothetical protein II669_00605 [Elusimicrobia bacterium]|nr:hypothetical protein [Elusimicrobiota bacterium]